MDQTDRDTLLAAMSAVQVVRTNLEDEFRRQERAPHGEEERRAHLERIKLDLKRLQDAYDLVGEVAGEEEQARPADKPKTTTTAKKKTKASLTKPQLVDLSDEEFAARVQAITDQSPHVWPKGGGKVFVIRVWRTLDNLGETEGLSLDEFKTRLVDVHRKQLLSLSRCDLVEAATPEDVEQSETRYRSAEFHLIERSERRASRSA